MLKLKKLQVLGFKSFCDRTELQFPGSGVVGVVGPNGCGKSNLADAISWVLGEQSAKSLRGGRMEDVIFAGTRDKAPTGMAEVSLTLVDPEEYALGIAENGEPEPEPEILTPGWGEDSSGSEEEIEAEAEPAPASAVGAVVLTIRPRRRFRARNRRGEILVTRRLYRDGQSEYMMNGRPCRLRDIQELFMGTGLGPESYAIIEQGRIGQILSSKPYDRRAMLEEAAGVSKYKAKRRQAEARLEASRLNLSRINDIFEEVTRQVGSLKRQSAKAERYREYKAELDTRQRELLARRAAAMEEATAELQARHGELHQAVAAAGQEVEAREAERSAALERCRGLEQQLRAGGEEAARLRLEGDHVRQQCAFDEQQAVEMERRGEAVAAASARAGEQRTAIEGERAQAEAESAGAGQLLAQARTGVESCLQEHTQAQAAEAATAAAQETTRARGLELLARQAQLDNRITQEQARQEEFGRLLERLEREQAAALEELEAGGARRGQLQLAFEDQQAEATRLHARTAELDAEAAAQSRVAAAAREAEQQARTRLAAANARRRSLEEIAAGHGYSSEAVKRLFAAGDAAAVSPKGVLGEFIEVEAPYDRLVEQFLQDELNYVVVGGWEQAAAGVGLLRAEQQGRATFLVHDAAGAAASPLAAAAAPEPEGALPLAAQVRALNGFRGGLETILPRLRQAYVARDAAQARELALRHPQAWFLTQEGECYHHATVTGGAGRAHGPLSLKRELRELQQQETSEEAAAAHHQQEAAVAALAAERLHQGWEQNRLRLHELDKQRQSSDQAVRQLEQDLQRAQARLAQAELEAARTRSAQAEAGERLQAAQAARAAGEEEHAALTAQQAEAARMLATAQTARAAAGQSLAAAQAELARVEERARAAQAAAARLEGLARELEERLAQGRREGEELSARRRSLLAAAAAEQQRAQALQSELAEAEQAQTAATAALAEAQTAAQHSDIALREHRQALEERRQALGENEVARARLEADGEHLRQTCRDDLNCELEALLATAAAAEAAAMPLEALDEAVRALRQRIEHLGPVNMMALEEYEEARQRHEFMETQRRDLLDSIADTQKAIQEMDAISRQKFQEAFERINEYFQESFRVLFGGGQGFLRLSETEGGTASGNEAGMDIVAQPPGKKLQNALLLSGGEKAMTAMALLLAIFRYQPSPFCLLDEVDAPMDEANVARFTDMVQRMSTQTQFILITHNKRSMEAAGTLYGVTMPQPGCSRLVSVKMEEPQRAAASA